MRPDQGQNPDSSGRVTSLVELCLCYSSPPRSILFTLSPESLTYSAYDLRLDGFAQKLNQLWAICLYEVCALKKKKTRVLHEHEHNLKIKP